MQNLLDELLKYKNDEVIERYSKKYPHSVLSAEEALSEFMKYVWLCLKHTSDKKCFPQNNLLNFTCAIHAEMEEIDNMWHTFIIFTRDYKKFCDDYLGGDFFHHVPASMKMPKITKKKYKEDLNRYLNYIAENLGEETLIKWFAHSP